LEKIFPVDDESRDEFIKCSSLIFGEANKPGLIGKKLGFYILTAGGRKKVEVDQYSIFKNICPSF
jgi:hypothetical protein